MGRQRERGPAEEAETSAAGDRRLFHAGLRAIISSWAGAAAAKIEFAGQGCDAL